MPHNIELTPKILKDKTRRKIIVVLHDKDGLTYSDLLEALKTTDRGKLNYHLKLLSPFIAKNNRLYFLNEQGLIIWESLLDFSYKEKIRLASTIKCGRITALIGLATIFFLSYKSYVSTEWLFACVIVFSIFLLAIIVLIKFQCNKVICRHFMDCSTTSLYDALGDENRRKIILFLRENEKLGYSQLMKVACFSSGQLNYHLKVLGDLILTDSNGQYSLTDKGVFAYSVINSSQRKMNFLRINSPWKQWIGPTTFSALFFIGIVILFLRGTLNFENLLLNLITFALTSGALFYFSKVDKR